MKAEQRDGNDENDQKVRLVLGAMLLAGVLYALVTVPGLASDLASTVPERPTLEAFR